MPRNDIPQASEPVIMPQVVCTESGELHEAEQRISVKQVVLEILGTAAESPEGSPERT